ncbi:response regulator [Segatella copri]|uniref:response regulator n=1 Tax=Segatella copri TaxID=165179 RepID=UPI00294B1B02|nr:response regulator [Segatella copri]
MMQIDLFEVLVVDDVLSAAEDFARLIHAKTGLKTTYTSSAKEAINIVQCNDIKVLVLDQVMPEKTGTELLKELRQYTSAKALMLTGEASKDDLGEAINLKFDAHLDKALATTSLCGRVTELYALFEDEFREKVNRSKSLKRTFTLCKFKLYKAVLFYDKIIHFGYVDLKQAQTLLTIFSGQEQETESEIVYAEEIIVEQSASFDAKFGIEIPIQDAVAKMERSIANSIRKITTVKKNKKLKNISKYHLTEKDSEKVDHRIITYAPIYEIHKMIVGYKIPFIGKYHRSLMIVYEFTGEYQLFQKDFFKDGTEKERTLSRQKF